MATAEELLATMAASEVEEHIVIGADRTITVPPALKAIAVQHDHNIETVTFDCPRYWDEHDFSTMSIYVNYRNAKGEVGQYPVTNVTIDTSNSNIIHFDWTISEYVTRSKGKISFLVCIYTADSDGTKQRHWNSRLNQDMEVLEGLELDGNTIYNQNPDIIENMLARIESLENGSGGTSSGSGSGSSSSSGSLPADAMSANVYDPQGKQTDIFKYVDSKVAESGGNSGETAEEPAVTGIDMVRDGSTVTITYSMDDGTASRDILTLDENGYPTNLNVDGADVPITLSGFTE